MRRRWAGLWMAPVLVAATVVTAPGAATGAVVPIAVPRDLGTGQGTSSSSVALAGRVVVGYMGVPHHTGEWLFQYDLDAVAPTMNRLDDRPPGQGNLSSIADADGPFVVGAHQAGTASRSAYVYDLRSQTVTTLDRLGGLQAHATAVDGGVVVGTSEVGPSQSHAFAYAADGAREVIDIGTLGGPQSAAADVSGTTVVGQADRADLAKHAFMVDLAAPGRPMVDLGTFGGAGSAATGVEGDLVVGWAEAPGGVRQAFAVRRSAAPGPLTSLGTLGGPTSEATDVAGEVVVGTATRVDGSTGIWWTDLRTTPVVLHDLGTPAVGQPGPEVMDGKVIGTRQTPAGDRGFVFDVAAGTLVELDPHSGHTRTSAADLSGNVVVGTSYGANGPRAQAWTLTTVATPTFRLTRKTVKKSEGRTARIQVVRDGDVRSAVEVRYRVRGTKGGASAKDFRGRRGAVRFEPGQRLAYICVKIRNDRIPERAERARVRIRAVTDGTTVAGRSQTWLVIRASDRRS